MMPPAVVFDDGVVAVVDGTAVNVYDVAVLAAVLYATDASPAVIVAVER